MIHEWNSQTPVFNTETEDITQAIAADKFGDIYVAYRTNVSGRVSGGSLFSDTEIVIFKLDGETGKHIWNAQSPVFNTSDTESHPDIAIDDMGDVFIVYETDQTISGFVGGGTNENLAVIKLEGSTGTHIWSTVAPIILSTTNLTHPKITVDFMGDIVVVVEADRAVSGGSIFFGGFTDIAVFKFGNSDGSLIWSKQTPVFNSFLPDSRPVVGTDSNGNIYIAYYSAGIVSGGEVSPASIEIVIFQLDINGVHKWTYQTTAINPSGTNQNPDIAVNYATGEVYVTYTTSNALPGGSKHSGPIDIAVIKLDANGNLVWTKQSPLFNTPTEESAPNIGIDRDGDLVIAYASASRVSGGSSSSNTDIIIIRMRSSNGNHMINYQTPVYNAGTSISQDIHPDITIDNNGDLFVSYQTIPSSPAVSGGSAQQGIDIVVAKFSIPVVICVHEDMIVDELNIPMRDLTYFGPDFVDNIYTGDTNKFIKIEKGALGSNIPTQDLLLTPGHPIMYNGVKIPVRKLRYMKGIQFIKTPKPARTYMGCFLEERTIKIHGVDVCQWDEKKLQNFCNKNNCQYIKGKGFKKNRTKNLKLST